MNLSNKRKGFGVIAAIIIGAVILGTAILGAAMISHKNSPTGLGAANFNPVQTQTYFLAGGGITNSATSVLLTSMNYANGNAVQMTDLGSIGYATIEPGTPNREEQVSFTNIVQNTNGTALLQNVTRGLAFNPGTQGCAGSSTLAVAHAGNAQFVLSNTACFYQQFAILANTSTITGQWAFSSTVPTSNLSNASDSANPQNLVTYSNLASTSFAGVVAASRLTAGIVKIASGTDLANGNTTTTYELAAPAELFNATSSTSTPYQVPVALNGVISSAFINQASTYNWTGSNTFSNIFLTQATSGLVLVNASGTPSALTSAATGTVVSYYGGQWHAGLDTLFAYSSTSFAANVTTTITAMTLPSANPTSIYNIYLYEAQTTSASVIGTSTVTIGGHVIFTCTVVNGGPLQAYIQVAMQNSTSIEMYSINANGASTPSCNSGTFYANYGTFSMASSPTISIQVSAVNTSTVNTVNTTSSVTFEQ